jgi:beta-lactamase regulating signal transducer with metallopeptidase domain
MESFGMQLWPLFEWLLQTTLQASLLIFLILLVQLMLRGKLGVRWHYCLWLLLLIRLVMPWAPESRISIFNLFQILFERGPVELVAANSAIKASNSAVEDQALRHIFVNMLPIIWLGGALVLICYMFVSNLVFWISVSRERLLVDKSILELLETCKSQMSIRTALRIIVTKRVKSPALFGFLRPVLLLPVGMSEALSLDELRYVFLHELAHLKRHDIFVAHFVSVVQILHWFNPLVWLAFYRMRSDRELACDALVLSTMDADEPKKYGRTIISLVELFYQNRHLPAMVGIMEDKLQLKRRIRMIARFKKISKKWSLVAVLVIGLIGAVALTNATSSSKDDADIREDTPMVWVGHAEGYEASSSPQGYGGYGGNADGDNALGYGGYSQDNNRPTTRVKIKRSRPKESDNAKNAPVFFGVSSEGSGPMGYGGYGGNPEPLGYGGYAPGYGASRVKDTEKPDIPDSNTPAPTP